MLNNKCAIKDIVRSKLTSLDLNYSNIDEEELKLLSRVLCDNKDICLASLSLINNEIRECAKYITSVLITNTSLTSIYLNDNHIDYEAVKILGHALTLNTTLNVLELAGNYIGDKGIILLSRSLLLNTSLTSLNIGNNDITVKSVRALSNYLSKNTSLKCINLSANNITCGCIELAHSLIKNTTLTSINISQNYIGDAGAKAFANTLLQNNSIKHLDVSLNNIVGDGAIELAGALSKNTGLNSLNIYNSFFNDMCDKVPKAFANALLTNTSLASLTIGYGINDIGIISLAQALLTNTSLTSLYLYNYIGDEGACAIANALLKNTSLTTLMFTYIDDWILQTLEPAFMANTSIIRFGFVDDYYTWDVRFCNQITQRNIQYLKCKETIREFNNMSNIPIELNDIVDSYILPLLSRLHKLVN